MIYLTILIKITNSIKEYFLKGAFLPSNFYDNTNDPFFVMF